MKILIVLVLSLLTSGCAAILTAAFPPKKSWEETYADYMKIKVIPREKWAPPAGAGTYCSPRNSDSGYSYCVSNVGDHSTRCDMYASGAMVCNTDYSNSSVYR